MRNALTEQEVKIVAIYHLEAKVITRSKGRTAVGAAAYMSCSKLTNEYDGITHDYCRKQGLAFEKTYLPSHAPPEWADRSVLWNAVEASEKAKNSRLSRELIVALPTELALDENIAMLERFIRTQFVDDGMCADVGIHDTDGHNPHAHILLTVRPLKEDGTWQAKTEKEYLCIRGSEEKAFTASEFMSAQNRGWEKQYCYLADGKKRYLPPSQANGLERLNKYPKSSKYGRQNPTTERWNSPEQLLKWRAAWAAAINQALRERGFEDFVDHRSFKDRGIPYQPTVHEGVIAIAIEKRGIVSVRREYNRQIRRDNSAINYWANAVKELSKAAVLLIAEVAKAMERLFAELSFLLYVRSINRRALERARDTIAENEDLQPVYRSRIASVNKALTEKKAELREVKAELEQIPVILKKKRREAEARLEALSEDISELQSELSANENRIKANAADTERCRRRLPEFEAFEKRMEKQTEEALLELERLKEQAKSFAPDELMSERMKHRTGHEAEITKRIYDEYGDCDSRLRDDSRRFTTKLFGDKYTTAYAYYRDHPAPREKDSYER